MKKIINQIILLALLAVICRFIPACQSKKDIIDPSLFPEYYEPDRYMEENVDVSKFPPEMFTSEEARQEILQWLRLMDLEENRPKKK